MYCIHMYKSLERVSEFMSVMCLGHLTERVLVKYKVDANSTDNSLHIAQYLDTCCMCYLLCK